MNIEQTLAQIEQQSNTNQGSLGDISAVFYNRIASGNKVSEYLNSPTGWVYACAGVISDEIAKMELQLFKVNSAGDNVEEVFEHPILDTLNRANNFTTKFDLFRLTSQYLELAGEAPWYVLFENNQPAQIFLLRPDKMTVIAGENGELVSGYSFRNDKGKEVALSTKEIVFMKYPDTKNPFRGRGTLQAAAIVADIEQYSEEYNRNFFGNAASPGLIFSTPNKLTDNVRERMRRQVEQTYRGVSNAHKFLILESGLEAKPLQYSQRDMEFFNQLNWTRDKILGIFRVPRTALGITDDVNRANAEATDYVFAKRTIDPKMRQIIEQLNEFFVPLYNDGEQYYLWYKSPVPKDVDAKIKYYESGLRTGYLTINEVREMEGRENIGDKGDIIYLPAGQVPIDQAGQIQQPFGLSFKPNAAMVKSAQFKQIILNKIKTRNKISTKNYRKNLVISEVSKIASALKPVIKDFYLNLNQKTNEESYQWTGQQKEDNWNEIIKRADNYELQFKNAMAKEFQAQKEKILRYKPKGFQKAQNDWLLDVDNETKIFYRIFAPLITEIIKAEGQKALSRLVSGMHFNSTAEIIKRFIERKTLKFSSEVNKTTNEKIKRILLDNVDENEVVIAKKINDAFDDFSISRSKVIARTETFKSVNFATQESYKQSGVVVAKEWFTALDERVCPYCAPMQGKKVKLDESFFGKGDTISGDDGGEFSADYETIEHPPLHVNCRCGLVPVISGKKSLIINSIENKLVEMEVKNEKTANLIKDEVKKQIENFKIQTSDELKKISEKVDEAINNDDDA